MYMIFLFLFFVASLAQFVCIEKKNNIRFSEECVVNHFFPFFYRLKNEIKITDFQIAREKNKSRGNRLIGLKHLFFILCSICVHIIRCERVSEKNQSSLKWSRHLCKSSDSRFIWFSGNRIVCDGKNKRKKYFSKSNRLQSIIVCVCVCLKITVRMCFTSRCLYSICKISPSIYLQTLFFSLSQCKWKRKKNQKKKLLKRYAICKRIA